ncbi:MAG: hypothetical protein E7260_03075 [Lachnospiraceae bacterium]|nr:hypothetical protein [Lachnospiraceae bacterium]
MRAYAVEIRNLENRKYGHGNAEIIRLEDRRKQKKAKKKVTPLDLLLGVIALLLLVNLVFMVTGISFAELPKTVSVLWWVAVSMVVSVAAGWGL